MPALFAPKVCRLQLIIGVPVFGFASRKLSTTHARMISASTEPIVMAMIFHGRERCIFGGFGHLSGHLGMRNFFPLVSGVAFSGVAETVSTPSLLAVTG